jgi:hypothetical protein
MLMTLSVFLFLLVFVLLLCLMTNVACCPHATGTPNWLASSAVRTVASVPVWTTLRKGVPEHSLTLSELVLRWQLLWLRILYLRLVIRRLWL